MCDIICTRDMTQRIFEGTGILILLFALFAACSNPGMMLSIQDEDPVITVATLERGSIVGSGEVLPLSVDFDAETFNPELIILEIQDSSGVVLYSVELSEEDIQLLPLPVNIPEELETGSYVIVVTVFENGEQILRHESQFFYVLEEYEISGITSYPHFLYPNGKGLIVSDLEIPETADPYLRWTLEDSVLMEGYLSDGTKNVQMQVPASEGIYTIRLELFPLGPDEANLAEFDFLSEIVLEAQLFVSEDQQIESNELSPEEDYFSLLHFRGESNDLGTRPNADPAVDGENAQLAVQNGVFGFLLDGLQGFSLDNFMLPQSDGQIEPFSLSLRFLISERRPLSSIYRVYDSKGTEVFSLQFDDTGNLVADYFSLSSVLDGSEFQNDVAINLTLSLLPLAESVHFLWYIEGLLVGEDLFDEYESQAVAGDGVAIIAGQGGFRGILDELGIYHSTAENGPYVDTEVFRRAMEREFGADLVYAEGFDGLEMPEDLSFEGNTTEFLMTGSAIALPPGATLTVPGIQSGFDRLIVELEHLPGLSPDVALGFVAPYSEIATVSSSEFTGPSSDQDRIISLVFESRDGELFLLSDELDINLGSLPEGTVDLDFAIKNTHVKEALAVLSLLIVRNLF